MSGPPLFPCGRVSRRGFLHQAGGGFFGVAMGALWAEAGEIKDALHGPHFPARPCAAAAASPPGCGPPHEWDAAGR